MRGKNTKMSQIGLLANALGEQRKFNPLGQYIPDKAAYRSVWTQYDLNQYCSYLKWDGLPNGLTSWNLNRMLYFRGSLAGFQWKGKVYVLPYTISGGLNPYGLPVSIHPISYNGRPAGGSDSIFGKDFKLSVDINGDETPEKDTGAVLLYDSIPFNQAGSSPSRYALNQVIIEEIAQTLARVNISVAVGNKKILLVVRDPKQRDVVEKEMQEIFGCDSPFGIISSDLEVQTVQQTGDFNASDLFNAVRQWDSIRCFMEGISANYGNEKKEREITGELNGNEEQINLIGDMRLELAETWADRMNACFGTNITVKKRIDDYEKPEDGRGMDIFEEEDFGAQKPQGERENE